MRQVVTVRVRPRGFQMDQRRHVLPRRGDGEPPAELGQRFDPMTRAAKGPAQREGGRRIAWARVRGRAKRLELRLLSRGDARQGDSGARKDRD